MQICTDDLFSDLLVMNIREPEKNTLVLESAPVRIPERPRVALDPLRVCLLYLVFGVLWIIFSDTLLSVLVPRPDDRILISPLKGIVFIILTTVLLFFLIRHFSGRLRDTNQQLLEQHAALASREAEWETTFDTISDWITLISPDGKIIRSNRAAESLLGLPAGEIIGKNCFELVHGTACPVLGCPRQRMLATGKRAVAEVPMRDGAGWMLVTVDPVTNAEGEVVSAVHIVRDITESMRSRHALVQAKKKLNLLNYVTFNDIQTMIYTISGYQQLAKKTLADSPAGTLIAKEDAILKKVFHTLKFAQSYQDLGLKPARWQNVSHTFLLAISHLDFLRIHHTLRLENLEIFADPLLEQVFQILAENVLLHGKTATGVTFWYTRGPDSVTLFFEDDGAGIPDDIKTEIFLPDFQKQKGVGLFLAREILEITGISIRESGTPGKGARFEMVVPKGMYRFFDPDNNTNSDWAEEGSLY